ncbi:MAG: hypothetical protein ACK4GN_11065, partial [Runella sp.]
MPQERLRTFSTTNLAPLRGLGVFEGIFLYYKSCASPRLGGICGDISLLQILRLSEAWGYLWGYFFTTNLAPLRGLGVFVGIFLYYK